MASARVYSVYGVCVSMVCVWSTIVFSERINLIATNLRKAFQKEESAREVEEDESPEKEMTKDVCACVCLCSRIKQGVFFRDANFPQCESKTNEFELPLLDTWEELKKKPFCFFCFLFGSFLITKKASLTEFSIVKHALIISELKSCDFLSDFL